MLGAHKLLILPNLLLFSFLATFYDLKERKIPNWLIKRMILAGLIISSIYVHFYGNLSSLISFVLMSFSFSMFLYLLDFWCAGDVKFILALSLLSPALSLNPIFPLFLSIILIALFSFLHSIFAGTLSFRPRIGSGILLPFAFLPLFSLFSDPFLSFSIAFFITLLSRKIREAGIAGRVLGFMTLINFLLFPERFIRLFIIVFFAFLLSSIKMRGTIPSAPFISISFIYSLLFTVP